MKYAFFILGAWTWLSGNIGYGQPPYTGGPGDGFGTASVRAQILADGTVSRIEAISPQRLMVWPSTVSAGQTVYLSGHTANTLELFNGLGQKVAASRCSPGGSNSHVVEWVLSERLASGLYTLRNGSQNYRIQVVDR
jgi:hypothetical protein